MLLIGVVLAAAAAAAALDPDKDSTHPAEILVVR